MKRARQSINLRQTEMLAIIRERQEVLVDELSQLLDISPMTVRRDLQFLEKQGKVSRFHGGATALLRRGSADTESAEVSACRRWISQYAASLVKDGDTILINGSNTALAMLDYLEGKHVTVYTNNGYAIERNYPEGIDLRLFGGTPNFGYILTGDMTLRNLMDIQADQAFLGCTGISPDGEILCGIPSELAINETMIAHARNYYILADHTKIGRSSPTASFLLEKKGRVITDIYAPEDITERLSVVGMGVIKVSEDGNDPEHREAAEV